MITPKDIKDYVRKKGLDCDPISLVPSEEGNEFTIMVKRDYPIKDRFRHRFWAASLDELYEKITKTI